MNLGKIIAERRKELSMKQKELSEKADIPVAVLSKFETGKRRPNLEHLSRIGKCLRWPAPILMFLSMDEEDRLLNPVHHSDRPDLAEVGL